MDFSSNIECIADTVQLTQIKRIHFKFSFVIFIPSNALLSMVYSTSIWKQEHKSATYKCYVAYWYRDCHHKKHSNSWQDHDNPHDVFLCSHWTPVQHYKLRSWSYYNHPAKIYTTTLLWVLNNLNSNSIGHYIKIASSCGERLCKLILDQKMLHSKILSDRE